MPTPAPTTTCRMPPALLRELRQALQAIRYGSIELVIHDGRVVQLERREKVRFDVELTDAQTVARPPRGSHPPPLGLTGPPEVRHFDFKEIIA